MGVKAAGNCATSSGDFPSKTGPIVVSYAAYAGKAVSNLLGMMTV